MTSREAVQVVTRRFLQCRRRGPLSEAEVTRLLTPDAVMVRTGPRGTRTVSGAEAIVHAFEEEWAGRAPGLRMAIIRHTVLDDGTATGHWRREGPDDVVVNGRDTYTLRDGLICHIEEEAFPAIRIPEAVLARR